MTGGIAKRIFYFFWFSISRPKDLIRWFDYIIHKKRVICYGLPWWTWKAIDYLDNKIIGKESVFEWGAGGSTLFFLKKGCRVSSVEHEKEWIDIIEKSINALYSKRLLDLRYVKANPRNPETLKKYVHSIDNGGSFDVILIDGIPETRIDCLIEAIKHIKENGMIVFDDAHWPQYSVVPNILRNWERMRFIGLGPERRGVSQTDIYVKR